MFLGAMVAGAAGEGFRAFFGAEVGYLFSEVYVTGFLLSELLSQFLRLLCLLVAELVGVDDLHHKFKEDPGAKHPRADYSQPAERCRYAVTGASSPPGVFAHVLSVTLGVPAVARWYAL